MLGYIARRLLATIPVMTVVAIFVFLLLRLTGGDPAAIIAGDSATTQQVQEIRLKLGLERPIVEQFVIWVGRALQGDFGESYFFKKTVAELIRDRLEPTVALAICTLILAVAMAVPLGVVAAVRRGTWIDRTVISEDVNGVWLGFMAGPDGQPMVNGQVRLELQQRASKVTGSVYASSSWLGSRGRPSLPIEGSMADDVLIFKDERSILIGELTVNGDEMTGRGFMGRRPVTFTLRRLEMASSAPPR